MNVFRLGAIVLTLWSAGTIHSAASQVSFTVTPSEPLIDEPVRIVVTRLAANSPITVRAKSEAQDHLWWRSEIVINSGPDGQIDLGFRCSCNIPEQTMLAGLDRRRLRKTGPLQVERSFVCPIAGSSGHT